MAGEIELWQRAGRLIVERTAEALSAAAGGYARTASAGADGLRRASGITDTDGDAGRVLEGTIIEPTGMYGTDLYGKRIAIDPDKVVVQPLHAYHGEVSGLRIPATPDDSRSAHQWSAGAWTLGDHTKFVQVLPRADAQRPLSSVSAEEQGGLNPFYIVGKFDGHEAGAMLRDSDTGVEPVRLGAPEVGHLVAHNAEYQELMGDAIGSQRPVVLVNQGSGVTDPRFVSTFAGILHSQTELIGPVRGVVHPITKVEPDWLIPAAQLEARLAVDPSSQVRSEYLEVRHPRTTRAP
ncbi:hypothetical protein [Nocardia sienata]|uniref:hypothetical protein n=1 Tax=Nocardia sienata TaxID=248552 RepID=UPI0007A447BC|nr:hypothetical protein [Nocardia sienata]